MADATSVALENIPVYAELERRAEQAVGQPSLTDELTGLYNRHGFLLLVERALDLARRQRGRRLLLYADLDYLKRALAMMG